MLFVVIIQAIFILWLSIGFSSSMRNQAETERNIQQLVEQRLNILCGEEEATATFEIIPHESYEVDSVER